MNLLTSQGDGIDEIAHAPCKRTHVAVNRWRCASLRMPYIIERTLVTWATHTDTT